MNYDRWLGICHYKMAGTKWFICETKLILDFYKNLGNKDRLVTFKAGYREEREWQNRKKDRAK